MKIQAETIDLIDEQRILISMITDTSFIKTILPVAEPEHFVNPFSQKLFLWIKEYFFDYNAAPQRQITDIFTSKRGGMSNEEIELFELFLSTLNQYYEDGYNEQYFADKALRYLKRRSLEVHADRIKSLLSLDQIEEAENLQVNFKKVSKAFGQAVDPLDESFIERVFSRKDNDQLFRLPGRLGELTGWFCRNWLTVIQGPYKSGKSFWFQLLREIALQNGLRVLDINLEMSEEELAMRMYKGFTGLPEENDGIMEIRWPVFDCMQNQTGLCSFPHRRTNAVRLYSPEGRRPLPTDKDLPEGYRACDVCRRNEEWYGNYTEEIWFETLEKNSFLDAEKVTRKANAIKRQYGSLMRFKCYPRGSINVDDIRRLLDILEYSEEFIPDVINVDYPKIMAPENDSKTFNEEGQLDRTMMALAGLATERHCLINTASQINKEAIRRGKSRVGDASQSTRAIYAHAALVIGISQTEEEEIFNAKRFNVILSRFKQANSMVEARVLQQFQVGQPYVDSEYARANWGSGNGNGGNEEKRLKRRTDTEE